MVFFCEKTIAKILRVIEEAHDCADLRNDLSLINNTIKYFQAERDLANAAMLDDVLRGKYPSIEKMLSLPPFLPNPYPATNYSENGLDQPLEIRRLVQDYYGILYGFAMKKCIISTIEDMLRKGETAYAQS